MLYYTKDIKHFGFSSDRRSRARLTIPDGSADSLLRLRLAILIQGARFKLLCILCNPLLNPPPPLLLLLHVVSLLSVPSASFSPWERNLLLSSQNRAFPPNITVIVGLRFFDCGGSDWIASFTVRLFRSREETDLNDCVSHFKCDDRGRYWFYIQTNHCFD